jgi:hypothetical protein
VSLSRWGNVIVVDHTLNENGGVAVGATDQPFTTRINADIQAAIAARTARSETFKFISRDHAIGL